MIFPPRKQHIMVFSETLPGVELLFYRPEAGFPQKWGDFAANRVYDNIQRKPLRSLSIIA